MDLHGNGAARREKGKAVTKSLAGRKEKQRREGDTEKTRAKEARNRVGLNDRLGCGREEVDAREWGGGQKVGSSEESGILDQEV